MSAVSMNEAAKKTAQLENAKGGQSTRRCTAGRTPAKEKSSSAHRIALLHRTRSAEKMNWKANIRRAKMACRILSTLGFPTGTAPVFYPVLKG